MTSPLTKQQVYFGGIGKFSGLSASVLKIIAVITMVSDHTSYVFKGGDMDVWRTIGRLGFPIFAFFIAEGAGRTKNIFKYMIRLAVFAVISEVPFDLAFYGTWFEPSHQNVFLTLLMGLVAIWLYTLLASKSLGFLSVFTTALLALGAYFIKTDYDATGVVAVFLFYFVIRMNMPKKIVCTVLLCLGLTLILYEGNLYFNDAEIFAVFAAIPILLYNGQKGFRLNKYFFYFFYPGHLMLLYLLKLLLVKG